MASFAQIARQTTTLPASKVADKDWRPFLNARIAIIRTCSGLTLFAAFFAILGYYPRNCRAIFAN
jgi:hypothetical protein